MAYHYVYGIPADKLTEDGYDVPSRNPDWPTVGTISDSDVNEAVAEYGLLINPVSGHLYTPDFSGAIAYEGLCNEHFSEYILVGAYPPTTPDHRLWIMSHQGVYRKAADGSVSKVNGLTAAGKNLVLHGRQFICDFDVTNSNLYKLIWDMCNELYVKAGLPDSGPYVIDYSFIMSKAKATLVGNLEDEEAEYKTYYDSLQARSQAIIDKRLAVKNMEILMADKKLKSTTEKAFQWPFMDDLNMQAASFHLTTEKLDIEGIKCAIDINYTYPDCGITLLHTGSVIVNPTSEKWLAIQAAATNKTRAIPYSVCHVQSLIEELGKEDFVCIKS